MSPEKRGGIAGRTIVVTGVMFLCCATGQVLLSIGALGTLGAIGAVFGDPVVIAVTAVLTLLAVWWFGFRRARRTTGDAPAEHQEEP